MAKQLKKIIGSYLFICVVLCCLLALTAGTVTAKQRSEYNSRFTEYAMVRLYNDKEKISIDVSDKSYTFTKDIPKKIKKYKNLVYFTPFSCPYFFLHSVMK